MDGVFDLFHIGHLEAIRQCASLGDEVVVGVTGDDDAASYKRPPIISQAHRAALVAALKEVLEIVISEHIDSIACISSDTSYLFVS